MGGLFFEWPLTNEKTYRGEVIFEEKKLKIFFFKNNFAPIGFLISYLFLNM